MSTVIRVEKNKNYSVINNEFLRNKELSLKAKGLLAVCLSLPDDWNYSMQGLVAISKESLTAVRNAMKELEAHGYVHLSRQQNEKGQFYYQYIIYETPYTENTLAVNAPSDNSPTENRQQLSTKELSTEKELLNNNLYILEEQAPASLISLYKEFLEMKEKQKAPLSEKGLKMLIAKVEKLSNGNITVQKLMLENALLNNWKNVYKPKPEEISAVLEAQINDLKQFYGI